MAHYALIDKETTYIVNVVVWDGTSPWNPGDQYDVVLMPEGCIGAIGGTYVNGEFTAPPPIVSETQENVQPVSVGTQTF